MQNINLERVRGRELCRDMMRPQGARGKGVRERGTREREVKSCRLRCWGLQVKWSKVVGREVESCRERRQDRENAGVMTKPQDGPTRPPYFIMVKGEGAYG